MKLSVLLKDARRAVVSSVACKTTWQLSTYMLASPLQRVEHAPSPLYR
jgi:hypothetical protein